MSLQGSFIESSGSDEMNIGSLLLLGVFGSFAFLAFAIYSYLQDKGADKTRNSNQEVGVDQTTQALIEPSIEVDEVSNTAVITLQNGMKKSLSPIDMARYQRGVTAKQLNDEYMLRVTE
jgi:hypothetical protein